MKTVIYKRDDYSVIDVVTESVDISKLDPTHDIASIDEYNSWADVNPNIKKLDTLTGLAIMDIKSVKTYTITETTNDNNTVTLSRENSGFTGIELIGYLTVAINSIQQQLNLVNISVDKTIATVVQPKQ